MPYTLRPLSPTNYCLTTNNYLRYRIVPMSTPGVAAADAFNGEPGSFKDSVLPECLDAIVRTGGRKPAGPPHNG